MAVEARRDGRNAEKLWEGGWEAGLSEGAVIEGADQAATHTNMKY